MNEERIVLRAIQTALENLTPEVVGEVRADEQAGCLEVLNGQLTIRVNISHDEGMHPSIAHVHVESTVASLADEPLDACVVGTDEDRKKGLAQAGSTWVTMAGVPILSLCHAKEVGAAAHFAGEEAWGVEGCHGFVGPAILRHADARDLDLEAISQSALFDYVAELTPGGLMHIAKSTLSQNGEGGWRRQLEIDGHAAGHVDEDWPLNVLAPSSGQVIISRFAVYHYVNCPETAAERQALDDAITDYVRALQEDPALDPTSMQQVLVERRHLAEHAYWIDRFVPSAFARVLLADTGVSFSDTYRLAQRGGRLSKPLELMRNPVFARAQALGWRSSADYPDGFKRSALCSAELDALNNALHAGSKPEDLSTLPPLIPDQGASQDDVAKATEAYLAEYQGERDTPAPPRAKKSSWWQFWK